MALPSDLSQVIDELPASDRRVLLSLVELIESLHTQVSILGAAIGALDALDTQRTGEVKALRRIVSALAAETHLAVERPGLAELIRAYAPDADEIPVASGDYCVRCSEWIPAGEEEHSNGRPYHVTCYQAELRDLRELRAEGGDPVA